MRKKDIEIVRKEINLARSFHYLIERTGKKRVVNAHAYTMMKMEIRHCFSRAFSLFYKKSGHMTQDAWFWLGKLYEKEALIFRHPEDAIGALHAYKRLARLDFERGEKAILDLIDRYSEVFTRMHELQKEIEESELEVHCHEIARRLNIGFNDLIGLQQLENELRTTLITEEGFRDRTYGFTAASFHEEKASWFIDIDDDELPF